jgi:hypothetical protein
MTDTIPDQHNLLDKFAYSMDGIKQFTLSSMNSDAAGSGPGNLFPQACPRQERYR